MSDIKIYVFCEPYKKKCDYEKTNEKKIAENKKNIPLTFAINAAAPEGTPPRRIND